jgi:hypothetical protein
MVSAIIQGEKLNMTKVEKWLLTFGFFILWASLAYFAGGPIYSDEMLYIDVGLRNLTQPYYGNRYFHIYLQKLFMEVAPTPLIGIRIFWGFLMSSSAALIYYNARTLFKKSTLLNGMLALAIFFSFSIIREYSGEPAVDITAMTIVLVYLTVFLRLLHRPEKAHIYLFLLGMLAFLGLKTKETTIFIHLILVGLILERLKGKDWFKSLLSYFAPFLMGVLAGILVFIILDGLLLDKPFFAISLSTFLRVFDNYDFAPGFFFGPTSWYKEFLFDDILVVFILFIISGMLFRDQLGLKKRWVWIYPLFYISFLSWNMLKVPWGFIERFIFPALPVIAIFSAQVLDFKSLKKNWDVGISLIGAFLLFLAMRELWIQTASTYQFDHSRMLDAVYFPILISFLIASFLLSDLGHWALTVVQIFLVGTLLFTPLSNNFKYFIQYPIIRQRYEELFYPLEVFKDELQIVDNDMIYISTDLKNGLDMLSTDPNDISGMVNFYYDHRIDRENVYVGYDRKKVASDLINRSFEYALLTASDVASLMGSPSWERINDIYSDIQQDEQGIVYLLKR